jgi:glutaredoxin
MNRIAFLMAVLLAAGTAQAAQLYRWVDDKGRVEWRDTPPPASAKKVERRNVGGSVIETSGLPYSVQQAVKNFPLTFYVSECGESCTKAREYLNRRGVPYTEKNPQDDIEAYRKLTNGKLEVPLLFVGKEMLKGFHQESWDSALDTAGYPRSIPGARPSVAKPVSAAASPKAPAPESAPTGSAPPSSPLGTPLPTQ